MFTAQDDTLSYSNAFSFLCCCTSISSFHHFTRSLAQYHASVEYQRARHSTTSIRIRNATENEYRMIDESRW